MTIISAQKDRAIIIGGRDRNDQERNIVEEIDFLKAQNSVVNLDKMKRARASPNAFLVNDAVYVISRENSEKFKSSGKLVGEKYILKENKWKDFEAKNTILSAPMSLALGGQGKAS